MAWSSTALGWEFPNFSRKFCMSDGIDRLVLRNLRGRNGAQIVIILPIPRRANRTWGKAAATIRTNVSDYFINASGAKCAFESANAGFKRVWRKLLVAVFAGGEKGKSFHDGELFFSESILTANVFFGGGHSCATF